MRPVHDRKSGPAPGSAAPVTSATSQVTRRAGLPWPAAARRPHRQDDPPPASRPAAPARRPAPPPPLRTAGLHARCAAARPCSTSLTQAAPQQSPPALVPNRRGHAARAGPDAGGVAGADPAAWLCLPPGVEPDRVTGNGRADRGAGVQTRRLPVTAAACRMCSRHQSAGRSARRVRPARHGRYGGRRSPSRGGSVAGSRSFRRPQARGRDRGRRVVRESFTTVTSPACCRQGLQAVLAGLSQGAGELLVFPVGGGADGVGSGLLAGLAGVRPALSHASPALLFAPALAFLPPAVGSAAGERNLQTAVEPGAISRLGRR